MVISDANVFRIILTTLRGDEDGAIGTLIAVEGYGSSILENGNMVHLVRTDDTEVAFHTVDKNQRCAGAQTLKTTDIKRRILLEIRTIAL